MGVCVGRPVWGESDTEKMEKQNLKESMMCQHNSPQALSLSLLLLLLHLVDTLSAAMWTSWEHHIFSSKSKKVAFSLIYAETWGMVERDESGVGEQREKKLPLSYSLLVLSEMCVQITPCVCMCLCVCLRACVSGDIKYRLALNLRKCPFKRL